MKLGFYDSGLGGLSVLREFLREYKADYSYVYFGDSARAPYGNKSKAELKVFIKEILDYMNDKEVDVVISACNTTSMLMHEIDLDPYLFQVINLYDVMNDYFHNSLEASIIRDLHSRLALLATQSTVDSKRYLNWGVEILPIACPDLVPLIESADIDTAKQKWQVYLSKIPEDIRHLIIGCTHFSFVADQPSRFELIDPAKLCLKYFQNTIMGDTLLNHGHKLEKRLELELYFSKSDEKYLRFAESLL
ncbi:MAG: hypothetical protein LW817_03710 [Candidatus Caenarcaniphilales bacterium]|jgi:glutamate racemase|nr:hypothetical protein [Candidatus Caenarcaniphilales bacterium]